MNLKKQTSFLIMLMFLAWSGVYANVEVEDSNPSSKTGAVSELFMQGQQTVTGVVTDNENIPMPGVTVAIKGTTIGAITNVDGLYTLSAPSDAVLVFSFIGFMSEEVPLEGRSSVDLMMIPDI
ncbi:MAG: carboxypeptidase-like regulatory domain-containing protein, partial [Bacteroidales bacterium]|nr:carboxypeptidase-like regulatory domain-containing protein [Bacteroidales bacterium]